MGNCLPLSHPCGVFSHNAKEQAPSLKCFAPDTLKWTNGFKFYVQIISKNPKRPCFYRFNSSAVSVKASNVLLTRISLRVARGQSLSKAGESFKTPAFT